MCKLVRPPRARMTRKSTQLLTVVSISSMLVYFSFYNRAIIQDLFSNTDAQPDDFRPGNEKREYFGTHPVAMLDLHGRGATPETSLRKLGRDLFKNIPPTFSNKYKNPCWNVRKKPRQCLPYFYLIGMPKCGTTDVWNKLLGHPHIVDTGKEPHWWSRVRIAELNRRGTKLNENPTTYYTRWANALNNYAASTGLNRSRLIVGDGSASTLWDNQHWRLFYPNLTRGPPHVNGELIITIQPNARAIAILRNPTDRLYSDYLFFTDQSSLSPQDFHGRVKNSIARFYNCLGKLDLRTCTYYTSSISKFVRIEIGLYSVYVNDWLLFFPRKKLKLITMADWHDNCLKSLSDLYEFLELEKMEIADVFRICTNGTQNARPQDKLQLGPMLPETRRILDEFYTPFNQELVRLTKTDKFLWNRDSQSNENE